MNPIHLGIIGVGFHARSIHMPAYDLVPEIRLSALATSKEESAKAAAERYRVPGYADYRELLERADVEAVAICTPPGFFAEICRAALAAGKHVLLETPGISSAGEARELGALARTRGRVLQVAYLTRYSPLIDLVKTRLDAVPPPRLLSFDYYPFLHHTYNLALYLSGPVERILSFARNTAGSIATLRFKNSDTAVVIGRAIANCSVNIESVCISAASFYASIEGRTRLRIIGNMRSVPVEQWSLATAADTSYHAHVFAASYLQQSGTLAMLRGFAEAIRMGVTPRSTLDDAVETAQLMSQLEAAE